LTDPEEVRALTKVGSKNATGWFYERILIRQFFCGLAFSREKQPCLFFGLRSRRKAICMAGIEAGGQERTGHAGSGGIAGIGVSPSPEQSNASSSRIGYRGRALAEEGNLQLAAPTG
jgi:hypothetical protein